MNYDTKKKKKLVTMVAVLTFGKTETFIVINVIVIFVK